MSGKTMAAVLNEHWQGSDICGPDFMCFCGFDVGSTDHSKHAEHIAGELAKAGYGGPCEAARNNTKALYLLENEWGCGRIDVGQLQRILRGTEPDTCTQETKENR